MWGMMVWVYEDMEVWYRVLQYDIMMVWVCVCMEVWYRVLQYDIMMVWVCVCMEVWMGYCSQTLFLQDQGTFDELTRLMNQSLWETYPNKDIFKYE